MFSNRTGFTSIVIVIASLFGAQSLCSEYFSPQIYLDEPVESVGNCNFDDPDCFPTWVGIEQGVTEDGFPTLGSADAPIIIAQFGDYGCVMCDDNLDLPLIRAITDDYVRDGQAQLWYIPLATNVPMTDFQTPASINSAKAALCAADQGAFWQYHQEVIALLQLKDTGGLTSENLVMTAEAIELDGAALEACMQSTQTDAAMAAGEAWTREQRAGVTAFIYSVDGGETWTLFYDAWYDHVAALIESANAE